MRLTIDFETASLCKLADAGANAYAEHPSTQVLCVAFAEDDAQPWGGAGDERGTFERLGEAAARAECILAHNVGFERAIWRHRLVPIGIELPPLEKWECTAARAAAIALPRSLGQLSEVLDLKAKKSDKGAALIQRFCVPRKGALRELDDIGLGELIAYCKQDVRAEQELDRLLPPLVPFERAAWLMDQRINERGVYFDAEHCRAALAIMARVEAEALVRFQALTGISSPRQRTLVLGWLRAQGVPLVSTKKEVTEPLAAGRWPVDEPASSMKGWPAPGMPVPEKVQEVCRLVRALGRTSVQKYETALERRMSDGRARDLFMYCGCSTGRWSGMGFQPQNIPRGKIKNMVTAARAIRLRDLEALEMLYGDAAELLSHAVRGVVVASPGRQLEVADKSAIEARVIAWVAGDAGLLDDFRAKIDIYVNMARLIYGIAAHAEVTEEQRWFGKQTILGLGFGMGVDKFELQCIAQGKRVSRKLIERAVKIYRGRFANTICAAWRKMEGAALRALKGAGQPERTCKVAWQIKVKAGQRVLCCTLPSGRDLHYWCPKVSRRMTPWGEPTEGISYMGVHPKTKQWARLGTYGGKLVENVVQAIARDSLTVDAIGAEADARPIVMHVHDELVTEIEPGRAPGLVEIMSTAPEWAPGLPLSAAGWVGERYRK